MKKETKKKLTPLEEKRVTILKDAVAQIKKETYDVKSGNGYVVSSELDFEICELTSQYPGDTELKKFINKFITPAKPCKVCAKGALLISSIRKFNNFSLNDTNRGGLDSNASEKAGRIFGVKNADLMEEYFENGDLYFDCYDSGEDPWLELSDTKRLLKIFNNAIRNNGIFRPKQEKF